MPRKNSPSYLSYKPDQPPPESKSGSRRANVVVMGGGTVEFDVNEIMSLPSSDMVGLSHPLQVRVPPELGKLMQIVVESSNSPFQTQSDVIRAALFYFFNSSPQGFKFKHEKQYRSLMRLCEMNKEQVAVLQMETMIDETYAYIGKCNQRRHTATAKKAVQQLLEAIMDMEPGEWRSGFLEHIKATHGHLIQSCVVKAAVVNGSGDDGDEGEGDEYEGD